MAPIMAQMEPMEPWSERELKLLPLLLLLKAHLLLLLLLLLQTHLLHLHLNPLPLILPLCQLLYLPLNPHKSLQLLLLLLHLPLHHLLQPQPQPSPHLQAQLPLHLLAGGTHLADTVPGSGSLLVLVCAAHCQRGGELNVLNALTSNRTLLASLTL